MKIKAIGLMILLMPFVICPPAFCQDRDESRHDTTNQTSGRSILEIGNVGIGISTPPAKLSVSGQYGSPSIPASTTAAILRIGIENDEGIDIGKSGTYPFAGWIQAGYQGTEADPVSLQPVGGNVGIGTIVPDASSVLDINSTTKGLLVPGMTKVQRNAISIPATGLIIFQEDDTSGLYYNSGTPAAKSWKLVGNNAGQWQNNGTSIYYNGGYVGIGTISPSARLHVTGDAIINGLTIGKSASSGAENTAVGDHALYNNDATGNTSVGYYSLYELTQGTSNTAVGDRAMRYDTTGSYNTACGYQSLYYNRSGSSNTAGGYRSLYSNTTGEFNTAGGVSALNNNTVGKNNTAFGYRSLYSNSTGLANVAIGIRALYNNTVGIHLVAIGDSALFNNYSPSVSSAAKNTAVGSKALFGNTTGSYNTGTGYQAVYTNQTGNYNTGNGYRALYTTNGGDGNSAFGYDALYNNSTGDDNTSAGAWSLYSNSSGNNCTAIGSYALNGSTGSMNTAIGASACTDMTEGTRNTAVGYASGEYETTMSSCTFIGSEARAIVDNISEGTALGSSARTNADHQVRIGSSFVTSIGGYADWTTLTGDKNYNTDVQENVAGLDFIMKLRPVTYRLDMKKIATYLQEDAEVGQDKNPLNVTQSGFSIKNQIEKSDVVFSGFIAQDVESAASAIGYDFNGIDRSGVENGGPCGLRYAGFVVPLVKAVQEQQAIIEDQQRQIDELTERIEALENN